MDVFEKENGKFEKIKEKSFSDNGGVNDIQDQHSDISELSNSQKKSTDKDETQYEMVKKLELSYSEYLEVRNYCLQKGIPFISTAFDLPSLDFLSKELNVPFLKIPSGDVLNGPLLLNAAKTGKKIILSTGMCSLGDIEMALGVLAFGYMNDKKARKKTRFKKFLLQKTPFQKSGGVSN